MDKLNFGKELIRIRKTKGLTQAEVAEKCNITIRTIQRIESGAVKPRSSTIKIISEFLEIDFFEISNQNSNLKNHTILWYLKDIFNLKTNTMKKISILTISTLIILFLSVTAFNKKTEHTLEINNQKANLETEHKRKTPQNEYDVIGMFGEIHKNWALVKTGNLFGFINMKGEIIVPIEYTAIGMFGEIHKEWAIVKKDNQFGFIDMKGEIIVPIEYTAIGMFGEIHKEWAIVKKDNQFGFIDMKGEIIVPIEYTAIGMFGEVRKEWAIVKKDNQFGFIDMKGEIIVPIEYTAIGMFGEVRKELALVKKGNQFGYINRKGKIMVPIK